MHSFWNLWQLDAIDCIGWWCHEGWCSQWSCCWKCCIVGQEERQYWTQHRSFRTTLGIGYVLLVYDEEEDEEDEDDDEELSVVQRSSCHLWLVWMLATSCLMYGSCWWMSNWLLLRLVWFQITTAKQRFVGQCREDRMWCTTIVSDVLSSGRGMNYFTYYSSIHPSIHRVVYKLSCFKLIRHYMRLNKLFLLLIIIYIFTEQSIYPSPFALWYDGTSSAPPYRWYS